MFTAGDQQDLRLGRGCGSAGNHTGFGWWGRHGLVAGQALMARLFVVLLV